MTHIRGLLTQLRTTHEPPSKVYQVCPYSEPYSNTHMSLLRVQEYLTMWGWASDVTIHVAILLTGRPRY